MLLGSVFSVLAFGSGLASATTYAAFFSDDKCTKDKTSTYFSVNNPGCFTVGLNRQWGSNTQCFSLVKSPKPGCNCQFDCITGANAQGSIVSTCGPVIIPDAKCHFVGAAASLRFIGGQCHSNNCKEHSKRSPLEIGSAQSPATNLQGEEVDDDYVGYLSEKPDAEKLVKPIEETGNPVEHDEPNAEKLVEAVVETVTPGGHNETDSGELVETIYPRGHGEPGAGYYQLCQDEFCLKDCSIDFRTTNPGCIQANKWKSLNIPGGLTGYRFVASPRVGCPCQNHCNAVTTSAGCTPLPADITNAKSLRLVRGEKCDPNNC